MTAELDADAAFSAALRQDAGAEAPSIPAPPRREGDGDRDAPFGRDESGEPIAPHGFNKKTGRPNLRPGREGAGRPPKNKDDRPRVQESAVVPAGHGKDRDYTEDLMGLAQTVWLGAAILPPTRPYAQVFKQAAPGMVVAWNRAAQQNPAVRGKIEQWTGDSSWAWVIGVTMATTPVLAGIWELSRPMKDPKLKAERDLLKKQLSARAEREVQEFFAMAGTVEALQQEMAAAEQLAARDAAEQAAA